MKKILLPALLALFFVQCTKEPTPEPSTPETETVIPKDADAVMYITLNQFGPTPDSVNYSNYAARAWFGNEDSTVNAGSLLYSNNELLIDNSFDIYKGSFPTISDPKWKLTGSTSFGSWENQDPLAFAPANNFMVPDSISQGSGLAVKFKTSSCDKVMVTVADPQYGVYIERFANSGNVDISFTPSEIASLGNNSSVILVIKTIKYNAKNLNGKKCYFVQNWSMTCSVETY